MSLRSLRVSSAAAAAPSRNLEPASGAPDLLLVGHVTRDLVSDPGANATPEAVLAAPSRLGGTVSFAANTALRMGRRPTIVTRAASPADLAELPADVERIVLASPSTTTFANIYTPGGRVQHVYTPAAPITAAELPPACHNPRAVLLGPLVNEIGPDIPPLFGPETLVAAVPQGWMRRWDSSGRVFPKEWETYAGILPHVGVLVASMEDIDHDLTRLIPFFSFVSLIVMTEYREGSTIYERCPDGRIEMTKIDPRPAGEVDPTGAGDIFATAFLIRLQETRDPVLAARFANVTASYGVEHLGISGIPTRSTVLAYMERYPFAPQRGLSPIQLDGLHPVPA
ncbi:MAG: PfkB family carbohydrate kinase [Caldilineaceae bacterium]